MSYPIYKSKKIKYLQYQTNSDKHLHYSMEQNPNPIPPEPDPDPGWQQIIIFHVDHKEIKCYTFLLFTFNVFIFVATSCPNSISNAHTIDFGFVT